MSFQTEIVEASVRFIDRPLVKPLRLSTGLISDATEARASVTVRVNGRTATGNGMIYLSDLWAWPDASLTHEARDVALRVLAEEIATHLSWLCGGEPAHPLELGLRLNAAVCDRGGPPALACAMCGSPFDAALHDAVGRALGVSAFRLYDVDTVLPSADPLFPGGAARAIQGVLTSPRTRLDAWWIVGSSDSIQEDVGPAVARGGYRCFKLKILGRDSRQDAERTAEVYRGLLGIGVKAPVLVADSNGANPDAASVVDYLEHLRSMDADALGALDYLEQPAGRDISLGQQDWREVASRKPVFLDEGLTGLSVLPVARSQGWSGLALKTCKGHSLALTAAAWALRNGLDITVQDLTNPGLAAIHNALLAAHLPTRNGVEVNSPQYTPEANSAWLPRMSGLFEPRDGVHRIEDPEADGLGSTL